MAKAGRPRLVQSRRPGVTAEQEIIEAAAELFTTKGYAATTTREIAEMVGVRQASLFHHFPTKQALLDAVLVTTMSPLMDFVRGISRLKRPARESLHALFQADATHVGSSPWNLGALVRLPEVVEASKANRGGDLDLLRQTYEQLAAAAREQSGLSPDRFLVRTSYELVEVLVGARADGQLADWSAREFADAAFRYLGLGGLTSDEEASATDMVQVLWRKPSWSSQASGAAGAP